MLDILIIGGGASGMMAGIVAGRKKENVTIFERNDRLGKKLLATGNGRCNYTNQNISIDNYHGNNPSFAKGALTRFDVDRTISFFEQLGIAPSIDKSGKVYPLSYQSQSVLDVMKYELESLGVDIKYNKFVKKIEKINNKFYVYTDEDKKYTFDKVIVCSGGAAMPQSGSDGNSYILFKDMGHIKTNLYPGLVQLKLFGDKFKSLTGVKFVGEVSLYIDGELIKSDYGDILFTDYGISGPPILQLSRSANEALLEEKDVKLKLKILYKKDYLEVLSYLYYRFGFLGKKSIKDGMIGLVNNKLIDALLSEINIDPNKLVANIDSEEMDRLAKILIDWEFKVKGSKPFKFAQVTAGGLITDQINEESLESKIIDGLYFAGEIIDIDGDCGGYNLQWAWSSGYIAAKSACKH